jgi:glyoxylase-like metal-dependent hydrolase (beta-lactamase superfamily II)
MNTRPNPFAGQIQSRPLRIGDYAVKPLPTGVFGLDGGAMFGTVPKVLWEKTNPPDDHNRIDMEARALFLDGGPGGRRILIDCGIGGDFIPKYGQKLGAKFAEMYAVNSASTVENSLKSLGLSTSDITDVILTHLHFDHCGGATMASGDELVPTFPKARYYVQKRNLETARQPNLREKASYFAPNFEPLFEAGVVEVLDGARENVLPGVSVMVSDGHTTGQQMVKVSDGKTTLVYCGDVIPTSTHVRLAWVMGYDLRPLDLIEEKRALLDRAAAENWYLFFEHDPYMDAARVASDRGDFAVSERLKLG